MCCNVRSRKDLRKDLYPQENEYRICSPTKKGTEEHLITIIISVYYIFVHSIVVCFSPVQQLSRPFALQDTSICSRKFQVNFSYLHFIFRQSSNSDKDNTPSLTFFIFYFRESSTYDTKYLMTSEWLAYRNDLATHWKLCIRWNKTFFFSFLLLIRKSEKFLHT